MDSNIEINDISKWTKIFNFVNPILWTSYGVLSVIRYFKTGDQFQLCWGLFFIIAWIIVGIININKNHVNKITFDVIEKVIIKSDSFDRLKAEFVIKNMRKRRRV